MALVATFYAGDEKEWDTFMLQGSMNGTFLQTRKFINYHPADRFRDCSICIRKGNELVAAVLGCEITEEGRKTFFAHKGTTFGGITVSEKIYSASMADELMRVLEAFWKDNGYTKVYLKMTAPVYTKEDTSLLDYFLYKNGFFCYNELNYYLELDKYGEDITAQFSSSKRRDYRYSLKNGLIFRPLETKKEIAAFYEVLLLNLQKLNLHAVHSLEDLYDLKFNRFPDRIRFFGVYLAEKMIAGSMVFLFDGKVFHTQYLSSNEDYLKMFPMDFLIENLIETAVREGQRIFSFGICTEDQGRTLNLGLSRFKEGFGTVFCINRSYEKVFGLPGESPENAGVKLRLLQPDDAEGMLEWMHDPEIVRYMQADFSRKTLSDCVAFIAAAQEDGENIHRAITDEADNVYLGTVSLKHIRKETAEFAILIRKRAMGRGYSSPAMRAILQYGFRELKLKKIYWCVSPENLRAVRFYDKNGFRRVQAPETPDYTPEQRAAYLWYECTEEDLIRA